MHRLPGKPPIIGTSDEPPLTGSIDMLPITKNRVDIEIKLLAATKNHRGQ